jgi:deoxyribodipyrimidine photo-lyase
VKKHIVWFRNDLRIEDNEALSRAALQAHADSGELATIYIVPHRFLDRTPTGFPRTGPFRAQFLVETVQELQDQLQRKGQTLAIYSGNPADVLGPLCTAKGITDIWYQDEAGTEEEEEIRALTQIVPNLTLNPCQSQTLIHPTDLPFEIARLPWVFTAFRKKVEYQWHIREVWKLPEQLPTQIAEWPEGTGMSVVSDISGGETPPAPDPRSSFIWRGGSSAGHQRLSQWIWQDEHLSRYKETRNELLGGNFSSRLSPWLALGALSPREIYWQVRRFEEERIANDSTYWLIFELLWRDYFNFLARNVGADLFRVTGPKKTYRKWRRDRQLFHTWVAGETGQKFIDANMRELAATGYMSNRGRQNVASYFTRELGLDWRMGAEYFEYILLDYDPASNYGNWTYVAGVGTDPREDRWFNPETQAQRYDPDGAFQAHWLNEKQH